MNEQGYGENDYFTGSYPLTGGRSGARMAHAEDCLSNKPDDERASEFRRQAEGAFSEGERRGIERAMGTVEPS